MKTYYFYKICNLDDDQCYIGSTTNFTIRKSQHKTDCNNDKSKQYNQPKYKYIRDHGGFEQWQMIEIERGEYPDKRTAEKREFELIKQFGTLNKMTCYASNDKCEHGKIKKICKDCDGSSFCEHNKRKSVCKDCGGSGICEHDRIKRQCKDCGGDKICEHNKQKHQCKDCEGTSICVHNKHKSACKDCNPTNCECGSIVSKAILSRHLKSKKHIKFLEQK